MPSFASVFNPQSPVLENCDYGIIPAELIWELLLHLDVQTYNAHGIHPRVLKELKNVIVRTLLLFFNSLESLERSQLFGRC